MFSARHKRDALESIGDFADKVKGTVDSVGSAAESIGGVAGKIGDAAGAVGDTVSQVGDTIAKAGEAVGKAVGGMSFCFFFVAAIVTLSYTFVGRTYFVFILQTSLILAKPTAIDSFGSIC